MQLSVVGAQQLADALRGLVIDRDDIHAGKHSREIGLPLRKPDLDHLSALGDR